MSLFPLSTFVWRLLFPFLPTISPQDWAVSIDLKDAYLHVPVHPASRHLLGFQYQGRTFQYQVLPFGLKDSPWVFTRMVSTLVRFLRCRGIRIHYYLDDWLIVAYSRSLLLSHLQELLLCAQSVGFLINWEKSSLVPSQVPIFLGAALDFPRLLARPSDRRILTLIQVVSRLVASPSARARLWQQFLGSLSQSQRLGCGLPLFDASSLDLFPAPLPSPAGLPRPPDFFISTDQSSLSGVGVSRLSSCRKAVRSSPSYFDSDHRRFQPRLGCFVTPSSSFGSLVASGLQASHQSAGAESSSPGSSGLSVSHFRSFGSSQVGQLDGGCVHQSSGRDSFDSSVFGDSPSSLLVSSGEEFPFGISHSGSAEFDQRTSCPGGTFFPRNGPCTPLFFQQILRVSPPPFVDLFASSLSHLLPRYCARRSIPVPGLWTRSQSLGRTFSGIAFPPFALLPRVLEKVALDQTALLLVAPFWPIRKTFS